MKLAIVPDGEKNSDGRIDFLAICNEVSLCLMAMRAELRSVLRTRAVSMSCCNSGSTKNSLHESGEGAFSASELAVFIPITSEGIRPFGSYWSYRLFTEPQLAAISNNTPTLNMIVSFFIVIVRLCYRCR